MKKIAFWTSVIMALSASSATAYFEDATRGARPAGMGEAFVSVADDAYAVLYNPAGFSLIQTPQLIGMYSHLYSGLNAVLYTGLEDRLGYNFLSLALPGSKRSGNFGISWINLNTEFYHENVFIASYARRVVEHRALDLGLNIKILRWDIDTNNFTDEISRAAFSLDVGALVNWVYDTKVGLGLENIIPADVGVDSKENVPMNIRIGASRLWGRLGGFSSLLIQTEAEIRTVGYQNGVFNPKFGGEGGFYADTLKLRIGINKDVFTTGFGVYYPIPGGRYTVQLDYAYTVPFYLKYNFGSHRLGLTLQLCCIPGATAVPTPSPSPEPSLTPTPTVTPTPIPVMTSTPVPTPTATPDQIKVEELKEKLQEMQKKIEVGELAPIYFEADRSTIKKDSYDTLNYLGGILEQYPNMKVRLEGHTDSDGSEEYNKTLSQTRVEATQDYLVKFFFMPRENLIPIGYGETKPIADNNTKEGRAKNRRVELHVITGEGREFVPTGLPTPTSTPTSSPTISIPGYGDHTPTASPTSSLTNTHTPAAGIYNTHSYTVSPTPTGTATPTPETEDIATASTPSPTPTVTTTPTPETENIATASTPSPTPTVTATPTPETENIATASTPSPTPTVTATPTSETRDITTPVSEDPAQIGF